jgi:hypothetical protein
MNCSTAKLRLAPALPALLANCGGDAYQIIVSDGSGMVTSTSATLRVTGVAV